MGQSLHLIIEEKDRMSSLFHRIYTHSDNIVCLVYMCTLVVFGRVYKRSKGMIVIPELCETL